MLGDDAIGVDDGEVGARCRWGVVHARLALSNGIVVEGRWGCGGGGEVVCGNGTISGWLADVATFRRGDGWGVYSWSRSALGLKAAAEHIYRVWSGSAKLGRCSGVGARVAGVCWACLGGAGHVVEDNGLWSGGEEAGLLSL